MWKKIRQVCEKKLDKYVKKIKQVYMGKKLNKYAKS